MATSRLERSLPAVLAADGAGYSRLVAAGEDGTIDRPRDHRLALFDPGIAEHRCRLVKTTGDGLLADFAGAVDAVRVPNDLGHWRRRRAILYARWTSAVDLSSSGIS